MRTFAEAVREPTGTHFLDSGGDSGRAWQQSPVSADTPVASLDARWGIEGTIHTGPWLDSIASINQARQHGFEAWAETNTDLDWFAAGDVYMTLMGFDCVNRGNVYNGENDLTEVFVWEVWLPKGVDDSDWYYSDAARVVIYIHTGADVRGGYGRPLFLEMDDNGSETCLPMDFVCGFRAIEGRESGESMSDMELDSVSNNWGVGYSSWPTGQVQDSVKRLFPWTASGGTVCALLHTGEIVKIAVDAPWG